MILLSLVLVIAAAVLLVVGWFQDGLALIYLAIGACLLSMLLLGASVMLRRRTAPEPATRPISPASANRATTAEGGQTASRRTAVVRRSSSDASSTPDAPATSETSATSDGPSVGEGTATGTETVEPADPLADIRGLGPSRREALLERFGSVEAIRDAELAEMTDVPGVSPGLAKAIKDQLA